MEEIATVTDVFDHKLRLSFTRRLICQECGACRKSEDGRMYLEVADPGGIKIGDSVLVKIKPSNLKISLVIYGVPVLFLAGGIFTGIYLFHSEKYGFLTGIIFLILSFVPVKIFAAGCSPRIEKITPPEVK